MSDDLVKQARDCANGVGDMKTSRGDFGLLDDLADRIEALEAENRELALKLLAAQGQAAETHEAKKAAEAKLSKAEVIIRIIASDKWDERLGEAVDLSCEYLAELKGGE